MAAPAQVEMHERATLSRPLRLGTRRRRAPQGRAASEAGASGFRETKAPSLDTEKQLATTDFETCAAALRKSFSEYDLRREQERAHRQLSGTVHQIWQNHATAPKDGGQGAWWDRYEAELAAREGEEPADRWRRIQAWVKANKPTGQCAEAIKWEKQYAQLQKCQTEWIGYVAACCGDKSGTIAVPVGCNHRLCPFCNFHRSALARVKIKTMFDRLTHPVLLTLTVPNKDTIKKHHFNLFRKRARQFLAQHKAWILGGIYSLETTYNRAEKTWHIHAHILLDAASPLPTVKDKKVELRGERVLPFTAMKWRLEFDWLCLWTDKWGKMPPTKAPARRVEKWRQAWEGYEFDFGQWVEAKRAHSTLWAKQWNGSRYVQRADLSERDLERLHFQSAWNARNTRVIDVRPVLDRAGAAREVLKYITKSADFADLPEAVEAFVNATRGLRLIQTFGTWYGLKIDTLFDAEHMDDWGEMKCSCGLNMWEKIGVFYRRDVAMDKEGKWHLKDPHNHHAGGTVPRPTIRALDVRESDIQPWEQQ